MVPYEQDGRRLLERPERRGLTREEREGPPDGTPSATNGRPCAAGERPRQADRIGQRVAAGRAPVRQGTDVLDTGASCR
jgi:hypothetical protein